MSKITKATFKSFIKKNRENLLIKCKSSFDGMFDCVMPIEDSGFTPALDSDGHKENTCGIHGVWLVNGSRDHFSEYSDGNIKGISVYNCCGSFVIGVKVNQ